MLYRIKQIIENEKISVKKFEEILGVYSGAIAKAIRNDTSFSCLLLPKIIEKFPQYSCEWLLTGKGPMLKSEVSSEDIAPKQDETELTEQLRLNQKVMLKQIELLESENERLKKELSEQESKRVKFGSSDCSSLVG